MSNAVSYSRHGLYAKCPASYEWQYVLGHKEAFSPGPAAQRGTRIHNSIEDYYNGKREELDDEIPYAMVDHIVSHKRDGCEDCRPEYEFAVTKDWKETTFDAEDAYMRGYMDNLFLYPDKVIVHEYKTGGIYDDHVNQKALYAMIVFILFPQYDSVMVEGIYIDKKKIHPTTYNRAHLHSMQYTWKRNIDKMSLPIFPARPGIHCRWCPKSKKKGGTCLLG